jgi:hypothetical protein
MFAFLLPASVIFASKLRALNHLQAFDTRFSWTLPNSLDNLYVSEIVGMSSTFRPCQDSHSDFGSSQELQSADCEAVSIAPGKR